MHVVYHWRHNAPLSETFHRVLEDAIEKGNFKCEILKDINSLMNFKLLDDVVITESVFKNCAKHIDTIEHLGATFKPGDWVINFAAEHGNLFINN